MKKILLLTNLFVFLVGLNVQAATIISSATAPLVGVGDIGQLNSPNTDSLNIDGTTSYTGDNDGSTYVANDRTTQGQTFTTGANPSGYTLSGVYFQHVLYTDEMNNGTWSGLNDGSEVTVRVCSVAGTTLTQISSELATVATGSGIGGGSGSAPYWGGTGMWMYIEFDTPVSLSPNTEYSFDLSSDGPWFELAGLKDGPYSAGKAYSTVAKNDLDMGTVHVDGDRAFALNLSQNILHYTSPEDDFWGENPIAFDNSQLTWNAVDTNITGIDLYVAPLGEPNLVEDPEFKLISDGPAASTPYTLGVLEADTLYYWRIDAYIGGVKHIGPIWNFKTVKAEASVSDVVPQFTAVDAGTPAAMSATGLAVDDNDYTWFKIVDLENSTNDIEINNDVIPGKYDGFTTNSLTINDVQLADEGYYYCVASNDLPSQDDNRDAPCRIMIKRQTSEWSIEAITTVDDKSVLVDSIGGFDMELVSDDEAATGLPVLDTDVADAALGTYSLAFDNLDHSTEDPNGHYAQIGEGVVDYENITISAWVKWNGGDEWQRIFDFGNDTIEYMYLVPDAGGDAGLRFAISTGGEGAEQDINAPALTVGQWTYLVVTIDPENNGRLYVNGELVDTNPNITLNPIDIRSTLNYIGKSNFSDPEFNGLVDDLKIYNYARATEEIALEYIGIMGGWVCNNEVEALAYDFNDDCQVDIADFATFAATWLDSNRIHGNN